MKNYFYDMLPQELQETIFQIAQNIEYTQAIHKTKQIYPAWSVRSQTIWKSGYEEYRHIKSKNDKIWYYDSFVPYNNCGGIGELKSGDKYSRAITNVHECLLFVDEIRILKHHFHNNIKRKMNAPPDELDLNEFVGNWWDSGYKSPLQNHETMANELYERGYEI